MDGPEDVTRIKAGKKVNGATHAAGKKGIKGTGFLAAVEGEGNTTVVKGEEDAPHAEAREHRMQHSHQLGRDLKADYSQKLC